MSLRERERFCGMSLEVSQNQSSKQSPVNADNSVIFIECLYFSYLVTLFHMDNTFHCYRSLRNYMNTFNLIILVQFFLHDQETGIRPFIRKYIICILI